MPVTLNVFDSLAFNSRSRKGIASQGISSRYSSKARSSRSLDTKITSKFLPISPVSFSYARANAGVNWRQGGHQCAEK